MAHHHIIRLDAAELATIIGAMETMKVLGREGRYCLQQYIWQDQHGAHVGFIDDASIDYVLHKLIYDLQQGPALRSVR